MKNTRTFAGGLLALWLLSTTPSAHGPNDPTDPGPPEAVGSDHFDPTLLAPYFDDGGAVDLWTSGRPDGHAPIGVMGDHTHALREIMLSYRFMVMDMDGMRDGTNNLSNQDVFDDGFAVTPTDMTMEMHMFGLMYAWTDDLTFMLSVPVIRKKMNHVTGTGVHFQTHSDGIGDIKLSALYKFWDQDRQRSHASLGMSFPSGSIDEMDTTPASGGNDVQLPYPMQLGSGTFDLLPGITYLGESDDWSWGAQASAVVRLGENSNHYTLGNRYDLTGWGARKLGDQFSASLRLNGYDLDNIHGSDPELNPSFVPTADPNNQGRTELDLLAGINWYGRDGWARGQRLAVEYGIPVYQDVDGPQLEIDWVLTLGWQYAR